MSSLDYHVHTYFCEHADGQPEEYIETAIKRGIDEIGFSDHAPLPESMRRGITMSPEDVEAYIDLIQGMRDKYRDRIQVKLGFEVDFPLHSTFEKKYYDDSRIDFLIGSCHLIDDWMFDHPDFIDEFSNRSIDRVYSDYYGIIEELVLSGNFNIIGHFDLVKKFGHRSSKDFMDTIEQISRHIVAVNAAVEINTAGLRKPVGEIYPSDDIIEVFFNMNVPVTLGSDSHTPEEVAFEFEYAVEKIKKIGYRRVSGFSKRRRYEINL